MLIPISDFNKNNNEAFFYATIEKHYEILNLLLPYQDINSLKTFLKNPSRKIYGERIKKAFEIIEEYENKIQKKLLINQLQPEIENISNKNKRKM